jgi:2-polyprenyl-6-methoxyphenol hydroxylase-like FAD-dependent oxidoreductase
MFPKKHFSRKRKNIETSSIAIIGASYAGLTLANYVVLHSPRTKLQIFESSKSIPGRFIQGFFNVPNYRHILKQIKLKYNGDSRDEIIHTLWSDRVKSVIKCMQKVVKIERQHFSDELYILVQDGDSMQQKRYGPFDFVIGADGVLSICRQSPLEGVLVIGDARWVRSRWYDFGFQRINSGGDIAMMDACELGHLICYDCYEDDLKKFRTETLHQKGKYIRRVPLFFILVVITFKAMHT